MTRVVKYYQTGSADVLRIEAGANKVPGPGQVLIRNTAIGVNFLDVYLRSGMYPSPLPATLGYDSVGIVEMIGDDVSGIDVGARVFCTGALMNAYGDHRIGSADKVVAIPSSISDIDAAALLLKGITAHFLVRRVARVRPGDPVLVLAAAGGVGSIACQWLKSMGAIVIGAVGSERKLAFALESGCDHALVITADSLFSKQVRAIIPDGVSVVFDSVGKDTFAESLNSLRRFGLMVCCGNASGKAPPLDVAVLAEKGSLFLTRPSIQSYISIRSELEQTVSEVLKLYFTGELRAKVGCIYPLDQVAQAHSDMEGRLTMGSVLLTT